MKPDAEIQSMLDSSKNKINEAKIKLNKIQNPDANVASAIVQLNKTIGDLQTRINEQQDWLNKYFKKSKLGRELMFVKFK
ncbi:MAG TPA: hypothetical protein VK787_03230 [Puia sp.]|jgi:peptidoglycan hydrolase CwlO-like protein|nr:hypothetical protein [Puia sp.]